MAWSRPARRQRTAHQLKLLRGVGLASQRRDGWKNKLPIIVYHHIAWRLTQSQRHVHGATMARTGWYAGHGQPVEYDALTDPCLSRFWALKAYGQKRGGTSASSFVKALVRKRSKVVPGAGDAAFSGVYDTTGILRPRSSCSQSSQSRLPMSRPLSSHSSLLTVADDSADEGIEMNDLLDALSQSPTRPTSGFNGAIKATHELAVWPHHPLSLCSLATREEGKDSLGGFEEDTRLAREVTDWLRKGKLNHCS